MHGFGVGHRADPVRHGNRADLRSDDGGICGRCGLYPRGLRRPLPLWHRRRARPDASAPRDHPGKPLADTRAFVEKLKSQDGVGALPPIVLAALRKRMVALSAEIAQGVLFANASLSHLAKSLSALPSAKRHDPDFLIGNMLPVCITEDERAALALHRRRLERYVLLPNYRNYWKEAGYCEEMTAIEQALANNRRDDIPKYLTDRWIADNSLYGPAGKIRDRLGEWYAAGLNTPVLVPNSVNGNQLIALEEIFAAFAA